MPKDYTIRLQVIATAEDDGSNAATVTPADITGCLPLLNQVYRPARVSFVFDEVCDFTRINSTVLSREFTLLELPNAGTDRWDHEPRVDRITHVRALSAIAAQFPGKLVLLFCNRMRLYHDTAAGTWRVATAPNSSGGNALFVYMKKYCYASNLAHEIGHYLQLWHPFSDHPTVAGAAEAIRQYVETGGHPKNDGLAVFDHDREWVTDTPPDAGTDIFADAGVANPNGSVGQIQIPVTFSDNSSKTYTLAPDRTNVMSYFETGTYVISPQQACRVRDGLEKRVRHDLISVRPRFSHRLIRAGTATAGGVSGDIALVMVRGERIASALKDADGNLRLIIWDLSDDGTTITRRGQAVAGPAGRFALCSAGLNLLATAVQTAAGNLKVIVWRVEENGAITRLESAEKDGGIKDVTMEAAPHFYNYLVTASRLTDDTLRADVWHVTAEGSVTCTSSATAGKMTALGPVCGAGAASCVTYLADEAKRPKPILWAYDEDEKLTRLGDCRSSGSAGGITGCSLSRTLSVAAFHDTDGLRLVAYRFADDGRFIEEAGTAHDIAGSEVPKICRLGTEMVVTADIGGGSTPGARMRLILWQVTPGGSDFVRLDEAVADDRHSALALCQAGTTLVVTAQKNSDGTLKLIAWRLQGRFVAGRMPDELEHVFAGDLRDTVRSDVFDDDPRGR